MPPSANPPSIPPAGANRPRRNGTPPPAAPAGGVRRPARPQPTVPPRQRPAPSADQHPAAPVRRTSRSTAPASDQPPSFAPAARPDTARAMPVGQPPASPPDDAPRSYAPGRPAAPSTRRLSERDAAAMGTAEEQAAGHTQRASTIGRTRSDGRQSDGTFLGATDSPAKQANRPRGRRRRVLTVTAVVLVVLLVAAIAWPLWLVSYANGKLQHVTALSGAAATPGQTYLIVGSDSRDGAGEEVGEGTVSGQRTDTIMLLNVPESGAPSLVSLPRDSYIPQIGDRGAGKLNASFAWGGAPLLVTTVENLTGLTIDHYVEVGFGGVEKIVNALGGVTLCVDEDSVDPMSGLNMTKGCHLSDGTQALAFVRARYFDKTGDIGRMGRQQQFISALSDKVEDWSLLFKPGVQIDLVDTATAALTVDDDSSIIDLGKLALGFRSASGEGGFRGTPPIANPDYRPGGVGSTVLLDPDQSPAFWTSVRDGTIAPSQ